MTHLKDILDDMINNELIFDVPDDTPIQRYRYQVENAYRQMLEEIDIVYYPIHSDLLNKINEL